MGGFSETTYMNGSKLNVTFEGKLNTAILKYEIYMKKKIRKRILRQIAVQEFLFPSPVPYKSILN